MHENTFTSTKHSNNYKHNKQIKQKHTNIWEQTKHNITRTHTQTKQKQRKKKEPYLIVSNKNLNPWNLDAFLNLHIVEEGGSTSLKGKYPFKQKWS